MNPTAIKIHALAIISMIILLLFQVKQTELFQQSLNDQVHATLEHIIRMDAQSEQDMLLLQNHSSNHYDTLTDDVQDLKGSVKQLNMQLTGLDQVAEDLQALQASINIQEQAIDNFKSDFSIMLNSQRYLPILFKQLSLQYPNTSNQLLELNNEVFQWLVENYNDSLKHNIKQKINWLQDIELTQLAHHIGILMEYKERVHDHIQTSINCGTPENTRLIAINFDALYAQQVQQHQLHRLKLLALSIFLLLYLCILLIRYARSLYDLHQAHQLLAKDLAARTEAETRFRTLINASSAAIMTYSDGYFLSANPATLKMFDIDSEQDFCKKSPNDLSPTTQSDGELSIKAVNKHIKTALKQGSCVFEWLHQTSKGKIFPAQVQLTALHLQGSTILQAIVSDLSELRQAQAEKIQFTTALEYAAEAIMISDLDTHIQYVNPAFEHIFTYSATSIKGQSFYSLQSSNSDSASYEQLQIALQEQQRWKGELLIQDGQGDDHLINISFAPVFDKFHHMTGYVSTINDITKQKQQQEKLDHAQRLESLGVLAGGIAHDFNNILAVIMGNAALARQKLEKTQDISITKYLTHIENGSEKAASLCKQMLAYSGQGKQATSLINLSELVKDITQLLNISISKNISLQYHLIQEIAAIQIDVAQIQQVIMNLVLNANDAITSGTGHINISTYMMDMDQADLAECFAAEQAQVGRYVCLEVTDTGCGMSPATIKHLFDPFFTTKFTGRGLGMSAVLGIIRAHAGAIQLHSKEHQGSSFKILLPASDDIIIHQAASTLQNSTRQAQGTILIVDDNEVIRETAAAILEDIGFKTLFACDGEQAIKIYSENHLQIDISLVLLDMMMPKLDGSATFHELKRINPEVKILLSSGYNEAGITEDLIAKGLSGFIQKPYMPDSLQAKIQDVLEAS